MVAQQPTPKPIITPKAPNLNFLKASDMSQANGLVMLIYGLPGVGKTTLAASAQDSEFGRDVAIIDCDGSVKALEDRDDILVHRLGKYRELTDAADGIRSGAYPFKTVVIDNLSEAQARDMEEITKAEGRLGKPERQDWGLSGNHLSQMMRAYRDLAYGPRAINVIFTCHLKEERDAQGNILAQRPSLTPSIVNIAAGAVDVIGLLEFKPKTGQRVLKLGGSALFVGKVRQGRTTSVLPNQIENPSMVDILRLVRTGKPRQNGGVTEV